MLGAGRTVGALAFNVVKLRYKSPDEIRELPSANRIVAVVLDVLCAAVQPGISTWELDQIAQRELYRLGVRGASLGYCLFSAVPCASVNEVAVYGAPRTDVVLQEGDILSVDFGHGIGHSMHETPPMSRPTRIGTGKRLKSGLVIAIEPMVNAVAPDVKVMGDKWTAVTKDQSRSAHFEHSSAITDNGPWVSSRAFSQPGNSGNPAVL